MFSIHWLDALTKPLEKHLDMLADSVSALLPTRKTVLDSAAPKVVQPNSVARVVTRLINPGELFRSARSSVRQTALLDPT